MTRPHRALCGWSAAGVSLRSLFCCTILGVLALSSCAEVPQEGSESAGTQEPVRSVVEAPTDSLAEASPDTGAVADTSARDAAVAEDGWTTEPASRPDPQVGVAMLVGVRVAQNEGFDRLVLEFPDEHLPGYEVGYAAGPAAQCGSGEPVELAGTAVLLVRLVTAQAHDEQGRSALEERALLPELPAIREARLVCDFEGHIEWALGVAARTPFRVAELTRPTRLVVDIQHPISTGATPVGNRE